MWIFTESFLMSLKRLLREVRACRICEAELPFGPRPVVQLASTARLLIVGQAPGSKVHRSGIPWNDASGDRLRDWLKLDSAAFYDDARVGDPPYRILLSRRWEEWKRQPTSSRVCTSLARTLA